MTRLLALDQGNHALKIALFDGGKIVARWRAEGRDPEAALRAVARDLGSRFAGAAGARLRPADRRRLDRAMAGSAIVHSAALSSVDPRATAGLVRALERMKVSRVLLVGARTAFPFRILVEDPRAIGADRLAAAAGVMAAGEREAIIVDAGTAVTVDVLSARGFLGGSILPGRGLMLRALHEGTAALPMLEEAAAPALPPGRSTREAILAGVSWGAVGAVKELVLRSRRRVSPAARVWVTGGGGAFIARRLGCRARYEKDLVFLGLRSLFDLNFL